MNNTTKQDMDCKEEMNTVSLAMFIFLNCFSAAVALLGNTLVLGVICLLRNHRNASHYFIASLSIADYSVGLIMHPVLMAKSVLGIWQGGHWLSKMADFMWLQTTTATAFSLCAVSFDRYVAILGVFPRYHQLMTKHRAIEISVAIWLFSILLATTRLLIRNPDNHAVLWISATILTVVFPLFIIGYCYSKIYAEARIQLKKIAEHTLSRRQTKETLKNKKAACTAAIVTGLFFVMWIPSFAASVAEILVPHGCQVKVEIDLACFWVALLSFSSSAINPWIYAMRMREFRCLIRRKLRQYSKCESSHSSTRPNSIKSNGSEQ